MNSEAAILQTQTQPEPRQITVLGSTGSIGSSTLDLIERNREQFKVVALTANTNATRLAEQAINVGADVAVIADQSAYPDLKEALSGSQVEAAAGEQAMLEAAERPADWSMAAISGSAGLAPTLQAVRQGRHIALANKECLVAAGSYFMSEVKKYGTCLLPVDSEHSAVFQSTQSGHDDHIARITLTASGGPFREWTQEQINSATVEDALRHPTWSMGTKITIDSATLMNKGLELIEAYYLFPVSCDQLDVVIHPQSIIHCLVEYEDGSVIAQMSEPDMRTPIAYSLAWPERMSAPTKRLDLSEIGSLTFEKPDYERFPALGLARQAMEADPGMTTVLNAANEIAVEKFIGGEITLPGIPAIVEETLTHIQADNFDAPMTLDAVLALDEKARTIASSLAPRFARIL